MHFDNSLKYIFNLHKIYYLKNYITKNNNNNNKIYLIFNRNIALLHNYF